MRVSGGICLVWVLRIHFKFLLYPALGPDKVSGTAASTSMYAGAESPKRLEHLTNRG